MNKLEKDFKNWLFQIARWKMSDYVHRQKAAKRIAEEKIRAIDDVEPSKIVRDDIDELSHLESNERVQTVQLLLGKLSWEDRDLLVLHYFESRTYGEIAEILTGKELNRNERLKIATTLRKRISRLHEKLGSIIKKEPLLMELLGA